MKLTAVLEEDEHGVWVATCPVIPGCVSQGKTRDEALKNIEEAARITLETRAELRMPLPNVETREIEVPT